MTKEDFEDKLNKLYEAVRHTYGYSDMADGLVDFIVEMAGASENELVEE